MKAYLWLGFHSLLVLPVFTSLPHRSPSIHPLIYLLAFHPLCSFFTILSSFSPDSFLFYQSPLSSLSHLSPSLCVVALESHQSQLCPSQQHRSGNESLPLRSSFITRLRVGRMEQGGDLYVKSQVSLLGPPYGLFISLECGLTRSRLQGVGSWVKELQPFIFSWWFLLIN